VLSCELPHVLIGAPCHHKVCGLLVHLNGSGVGWDGGYVPVGWVVSFVLVLCAGNRRISSNVTDKAAAAAARVFGCQLPQCLVACSQAGNQPVGQ
jgi:hypothetical protein